MVLGAGRGTRLGTLGRTVPKILVDIGGEPLLARQLRYLERENIELVVVNAHHLADQVEGWIAEYRGALRVVVLVEPVLLGTAGGVRNALLQLGAGPFVVLYGDVLVDEPLAPILAAHRLAGATATLTVYEAESTEGKGVVEVDTRGRVTEFREKASEGHGAGLVSAGLYVLDTRALTGVPAGVSLDFGHDVLPKLIREDETVLAYRLLQPVLDIGTPEALDRARRTGAS